jgi:hypothetical protein
MSLLACKSLPDQLLAHRCLSSPCCSYDLSYKGKTVGHASMTGVIVDVVEKVGISDKDDKKDKGIVVAVNAEIVITVSELPGLALACSHDSAACANSSLPMAAKPWQCSSTPCHALTPAGQTQLLAELLCAVHAAQA